jgi:ribosomal protein L39E
MLNHKYNVALYFRSHACMPIREDPRWLSAHCFQSTYFRELSLIRKISNKILERILNVLSNGTLKFLLPLSLKYFKNFLTIFGIGFATKIGQIRSNCFPTIFGRCSRRWVIRHQNTLLHSILANLNSNIPSDYYMRTKFKRGKQNLRRQHWRYTQRNLKQNLERHKRIYESTI